MTINPLKIFVCSLVLFAEQSAAVRGTQKDRRELWFQQVNRISRLNGYDSVVANELAIEPRAPKGKGDDQAYEYPTIDSTPPTTMAPSMAPSMLLGDQEASEGTTPEGFLDFTYPPFVTMGPSMAQTGSPIDFTLPIQSPSSAPADAVGPGVVEAGGSTDGHTIVYPSPPTPAPSPTSHDASCDAAQRGEVFVTPISQTVHIGYELLTTPGTSLTTAGEILDNQFRTFLASSLVDCSAAEDSDFQGVDTAFRSTVTDTPCKKIQFFDTSTHFCFHIKSAFSLYMSNSTTMTSTEIQDAVYRTMRDTINGPSNGRLGQRQLFISNFTDPKNGIVDIYFLNEPSSGVSKIMRSAETSNDDTTGRVLSASFLAVGFLGMAILGLAWFRRFQGRDDYKSHARSFEDSLYPYYETVLEAKPGPTPSPLSTPAGRSDYTDDLPATSLFEAYEATPVGGGNQLFYSTVTTGYPDGPRTRSRTQEITTVSHELPDNSLLEASFEELPVAPPPILQQILGSSSSTFNRTPRSVRNHISTQAPKQREKSVDPPPSTRKPYYIDFNDQPANGDNVEMEDLKARTPRARVPRSTPGTDVRSSEPPFQAHTPQIQKSEEDRLNLPSKANDDSFSVAGFLNGHCATIEGFFYPDRRLPTGQKNVQSPSKKKSPTSVAEFWTDSSALSPAHPAVRPSGRRQSSAKLWTSAFDDETTCSVGDDEALSTSSDEEHGYWSNDITKYFHNFSPYSKGQHPIVAAADNIVGKSAVTRCTPSTASVSTDLTHSNRRGRDRTPAVNPTNSQHGHRRSLSTISSAVSPKNPPGRRVIKEVDPEVNDGASSAEILRSLERCLSSRQQSSSRGAPVPRLRTPSGHRKSISQLYG